MKNVIIAFLIIVAIAFSFCTPQGTQKKTSEVQNEVSVVWKEEICPECKGTGKVKASIATRVCLGIISFGPGAMIKTESCDFCHGSGVVRKRVLPHYQGDKLN